MKQIQPAKNRTVALLAAVLMCMTLIPSAVFAEGEHVHSMELVKEVEATCEHSGMKAYYHCTTCDKLFDYKDGVTEVQGEELIIPIKDHTWDEGVIEREATPTQPGLIKYTCTVCGATYTDEIASEDAPVSAPAAKKFTLDGYKLQFSSKVVKTPQNFMKDAKIEHLSVKAAKKSMKLSWKLTKAMKIADGAIILRKTGKEKLYKEIARVQFKTTSGDEYVWDPVTSYTDKTAKKKNTPYSYILVTYYDEDNYTYISHCSDWAAGQTTASKLKSVYTAKISKKSLDMQYKGTATLKLTYAKPKTVYDSKTFRWYSEDKKVAKVTSKGKVTATGVGETKIYGKLPSGSEIACKIEVVGAFKPAESKLRVDVASTSSITLIWKKVKYATSYELYQSNDGVKWHLAAQVKGLTKKVTGLKKGHRYGFYVVAVNDNHGYSEASKHSNAVFQKAVLVRRDTKVTGFPKTKTLTSGATFSLKLKITSPDKRKASLQKLNGKKWETQKTVTLPAGAGQTTVTIKFPNSWWGKTTKWRLVIPRNNTSEAYTSPELKLTGKRVYQNPSKYIQISDSLTSHGFGYYMSKELVDSTSTRSEHVEALVKTANKYIGTRYVGGKAGAPGNGIDEAGLVMQACYGAGIDMWPISPSTRPADCIKKMMDLKTQLVTEKQPDPDSDNYVGVYRGDLIYFNTGKNHVGHVAIYLGLGKVIHASQVTGKVETAKLKTLVNKNGKYKYKVASVQRLFVF